MPKLIKKKVTKTEGGEKFKDSYDQIKYYFDKNRRDITIASAVILVVLMLALAVWMYRQYNEKTVTTLNNTAYKDFYTMNALQEHDKDKIKSSLETYRKSYKKQASPVTLLYIANAEYELGNNEEAEKALLELNRTFSSTLPVVTLSYMRLIDLYMEKQKYDDAMKAANELYALDTPLFKDAALKHMADILKIQGKEEEAKQKLSILEKDYPVSPFVSKQFVSSEQKQVSSEGSEKPGDKPGDNQKADNKQNTGDKAKPEVKDKKSKKSKKSEKNEEKTSKETTGQTKEGKK